MFPIMLLLAELIFLVVFTLLQGILAGIATLPLIALTVLFFYYAAKNKQQASFVKSGTIEFVVAGETFLRVLENIPNWHYKEGKCHFPVLKRVKNETTKEWEQPKIKWELVTDAIVPDGDGAAIYPKDAAPGKEKNGPSGHTKLEKYFGFFWVSWIYPQRSVYEFPVVHLRLRQETDIKKDDPLEKYLDSVVPNPIKDKDGKVIRGDTTLEKALLWKFPRPVLVRDVEFTDLYEANVLILCTYQIVRPTPFVFEWREQFFQLLEQAVQAATIDYLRKYPNGYGGFIRAGITGSQSPFFWEALDPLNDGERGFIKELGVYLRDAKVVQIQLSEMDEREKNALKAEKVAELEGDAEIMKAKKHAAAITTISDAEAYALGKQLSGVPDNPELLMAKFAVDIAQKRAEGNAAFAKGGGTTLVEGGAQAGIMLTPTPRKPPTP